MKTWDDWSDFEINIAVADALGVFWHCAPHRNAEYKWLYSENYHLCDTKVNHSVELPMYCSSPADMWPIIADSRISIETADIINGELTWEAFCLFVDDWRSARHKNANPLRAAAIVFLIMNGAKP